MTTSHMTRNNSFRWLAGIAVLAAVGSTALGQVRQIQMNSPLDANPQVGSGGANKPVPGFVPVNGNEVVTGNVSGLRYFHGQTGNISTYQFRGPQGSADIQGFARSSAGGQVNGALDQVYYLPSSTVSSGQGSLYAAPGGSGFDSQLIPRQAINPTSQFADVSAAARNAAEAYRQTRPFKIGPVGSDTTEATAFSLRTTETSRLTDTIELPGQPKVGVPATQPNINDDPNNKIRQPEMIDGSVNGGKDPRILAQTPELRPTRTQDLGGDARVSETYSQLIEDIRRAQGLGAVAPGETSALAGGGTDHSRGGRGTTERTGVNALSMNVDIDPFTGQPRRTNSGSAQSPSGMNGGGATTRGASSRGGIPSYISSLPATRLQDMTTEQLQAGSKVKPVRMSAPLASGAAITNFDVAMVRGDQQLKAGKYMDAADSYQVALNERPADPLALVGRANAEIGAGMYASAANDLKFVFTRRPELLSVRYDAESFIPASRQEFLLEDLRKLTVGKETSDIASFLYAYIAYQTGRKELLQTELKTWGGREGHDSWQPVLQRAWIVQDKPVDAPQDALIEKGPR